MKEMPELRRYGRLWHDTLAEEATSVASLHVTENWKHLNHLKTKTTRNLSNLKSLAT